jgi:hypothetical protein
LKNRLLAVLLMVLTMAVCCAQNAPARWSEAKRYHVAAINWGLVAGKTQTYLPWDSWQRPYVLIQPTIWLHEVFRLDDTPYRQCEVDLISEVTGRGMPSATIASPQ